MQVDPGARIIVHAGAGVWSGNRTDARAACSRAAERGAAILAGGGSSAEAVLAAVVILENDPSCNAGTGAVTTSDGSRELDACIMDGATLTSGAVGALRGFENPILIANDVRLDGRYHLLVGDGAAEFARNLGWNHREVDSNERSSTGDERGETVGAIALDGAGGLASATSTGGMAGQPPGRIGDTPIVGAGTYADERASCSCTGAGESFARACTAFCAVGHGSSDVEHAASAALDRTLTRFGGSGGLILLRADGSHAVAYNTAAMPWALATAAGSCLSGM